MSRHVYLCTLLSGGSSGNKQIHMLSFARVALAELARGISTGFILWSGTTSCPEVHCARPRIPDCLCAGAGGSISISSTQWPIVVLVGLVAGVFGVCLGYCWALRSAVAGRPIRSQRGQWGLRAIEDGSARHRQ